MIAIIMLFALALSVVQGGYVSQQPYSLGWKQTDTPVRSTHPVSFTVVVKEQGGAEIRRIASEVSNPDSPIYGQYLSQATVDDITRPAAADMAATRAWLDGAGVAYTQRGVSNLDVECPAVVAELLLATKYHVVAHAKRSQSLVRAGDFSVPESVQTVFGLHGMPLPPRPAVVKATQPGQPAKVTPTVIWSTYSVSPQPKVTGSSKNRQAVAEFQGQFMNSTDLKAMFKRYVPAYNEGVDDVITNHHGKFEEGSGIEAELDIQYIMGVAPGVQTEFWELPGVDFGAELNMWTSNLTSGDDVPLVHSVSYGWQGNLSSIGIAQADIDVVDGNFAKLAAKGLSIMIASGDSGSGYADLDPCDEGGEGDKGVSLEGRAVGTFTTHGTDECCAKAANYACEGWTFGVWAKDRITETAATPVVAAMRRDLTAAAEAQAIETDAKAAPKGTIVFKNALYHTELSQPTKPIFKPRDVFILNGKITEKAGGVVEAKAKNGTKATYEVTFSAGVPTQGGEIWTFNISANFAGQTKLTGRAEAIKLPGQPVVVFNLEWHCADSEQLCYIWEHGPNPPPPPPPPPLGTCTIYKTVTGKGTANATTFSGEVKKPPIRLWASWPASSPWVTAVGATRFVGQQVGNAEMATDSFGSGGGFYSMFTDDNTWQTAAVAKYLSSVDASTLPPASSYCATCRATPDVAALGASYQVVINGTVTPVWGTSASTPAFAAIVSLLNEARLKAGKPSMGFLNPFMYKNQDAFTDVVLGWDRIDDYGISVDYGFNCSAGWDPVTGLGTPRYDKLLAAAMA